MKSADTGKHSAAEQQAEQAGADETRSQAAQQAAAGPVEEAAANGRAKPGLPGWVMVRLNGCAALGAVDVLGGIEKVRDPREPELKPPPMRASAGDMMESVGSASDKTTAMAWTNLRPLSVNFMCLFPIPGRGKRPFKMGTIALK